MEAGFTARQELLASYFSDASGWLPSTGHVLRSKTFMDSNQNKA